MLIEAIKRPITYRWPGREIYLIPGTPVDLPDERAQRLLVKAQGKVRVVVSRRANRVAKDWLAGWREVAGLTSGITVEDSRFGSVMASGAECDRAFERDNWPAFQQVALRLKQVCRIAK